MPKRSKQDKKASRAVEPPADSKKPRGASRAREANDAMFSWRTKFIDYEGDWGWENVTSRELLSRIVTCLHDFETMSWGEITGHKHSHPMAVRHIAGTAKTRLQQTSFPAAETLYQLNMGGKKRVWGVKDGTVFQLLWWDPDHTVYQVSKKHT